MSQYGLSGALARLAVDCILMISEPVPDGGGGIKRSWTDGTVFSAAISNDISTEMRIAAANGVKSTFTVAAHKDLPIKADGYFKRISDGIFFRVSSSPADMITPGIAPLQHKQFSAERLEVLPK